VLRTALTGAEATSASSEKYFCSSSQNVAGLPSPTQVARPSANACVACRLIRVLRGTIPILHLSFAVCTQRLESRRGRPHLALLRCLPDGRWFDEKAARWRDRRGRPARWPDLVEAPRFRMTRVVLAAAHLDSDPTNNRMKNLRALCQRCHMLHDRPHHLAQRWITYRRRLAAGDLFLGPYPALIPALTSKRTAGLLGYA
jgi:hypothetical protein